MPIPQTKQTKIKSKPSKHKKKEVLAFWGEGEREDGNKLQLVTDNLTVLSLISWIQLLFKWKHEVAKTWESNNRIFPTEKKKVNVGNFFPQDKTDTKKSWLPQRGSGKEDAAGRVGDAG